jgi:hypothetical protein
MIAKRTSLIIYAFSLEYPSNPPLLHANFNSCLRGDSQLCTSRFCGIYLNCFRLVLGLGL